MIVGIGGLGVIRASIILGWSALKEGFKVSNLHQLKQRDKIITYIGDGLSDLEAARHANYIFATGHLANLLTEEHISSWRFFNDFSDIRNKLTLLE